MPTVAIATSCNHNSKGCTQCCGYSHSVTMAIAVAVAVVNYSCRHCSTVSTCVTIAMAITLAVAVIVTGWLSIAINTSTTPIPDMEQLYVDVP